jgi:L-2-hydroxyglutarate oxidase LhgO
MADVVMEQQVTLRVTDGEWRLIMKSLAAFAGVKIASAQKPEEQAKAAELNKHLLGQRVSALRSQLQIAEGALKRAIESDAIEQALKEQLEPSTNVWTEDTVGPVIRT